MIQTIHNRVPFNKILYQFLIIISAIILPCLAAGQGIIGQWDFEDQDSLVDTYTPENTGMFVNREIGSGVTATYQTGDPGFAISTDGWDNGNGSKFWMVEVNTSNTDNLVVKWNQYSDANGPMEFRFQYRIGLAGVWLPAVGNNITLPNSAWTSNFFVLPAACNNQTSVYFRWIMRSNLATGGGLVTAAGHNLMDNITFTGDHDYSCFTDWYLTYYTCGADYNFQTAGYGSLKSTPPGTPGAPDYGGCWQNNNSGNRATWIVIHPTLSGPWTFVFTPNIGNVNAWIWGGYTSLPNRCDDLIGPLDCNNGAGGSPISITANVVAGLYYVTLVTNPTAALSFVNISTTSGTSNMLPPLVYGAENCGPASFTLKASGADRNEIYEWYDSQIGGTLLKRSLNNLDSIYVTPFLLTTQTYWVSKHLQIEGPPVDSCESERVPVEAIISVFPVMPDSIISSPPNLCYKDTGKITLTAFGGSGITLRWFTGSCGSTEIGIGNPIILPSPLVTTTYFARWENFCGVSPCASITLNVQSEVFAGAIGADQTICEGDDPAPLINIIPGTGSGIITYRWEIFTGAGPWTVIPGETGSSYDPPPGLMTNALFRRITVSTVAGVSCESPPTPFIRISINFVDPGIVGIDQQICSGGSPVAFTEIKGATGFGAMSYQWQSSTISCAGPWTDISGATGLTYTAPPGLIQNTFFHRVVTFTLNVVDCSAASCCVSISILPIPVVTTTPPSQVLCSNGTTAIALSSGTANTIFSWTVAASPPGSITGATAGNGNNIIQTLINTTSDPATLTYIVTPSANGCPGLPITVTVLVNPTPDVIATPSSQTICWNGTTNILLSGSTVNTNFTWTTVVNPAGSITGASNGSGNTISQTLINNSPTPATVTYTIVPTANGCPGIPADVIVTVNPLPVPSINGPPAVCVNSTGNVYNTEAGMSNYSWTVTGGTITSGNATNSVTVTWNMVGAQSISVSYTDVNGCNPPIPSSLTIIVTTIVASVTGTDETCFGADDGSAFVNITSGTPGYTFLWNDPMAQTTNPAINLSTGTYTVSITDAAMCSTSRTVTLIQQYPTPSATLTMASGLKICKGDSVILSFALTGTAPWSLSYSDGTIITTVNGIMSSPFTVKVYPLNSCVYTITALTDAHCTAVPGMLTGSAAVNVFPLPVVDYTWQFGGQNDAIQFYIDSTVTNLPAIGYMVLWNFGDGTYGYEHHPLHIFPAANTFVVTLTVTDTNGCVNSVTHQISVTETPHAFFSSTSPVCKGQPVCFSDLSFIPSPPFEFIKTWIWDFGDGSPKDSIHFPNNPNTCHVYNNTLYTYPVSLTIIDNENYIDTYTGNIFINPSPVAAFTSSEACQHQAVQFTDSSLVNGSVGIISWDWDFGDPVSGINNISQLQNPEHIFNTGGQSYPVRLIITNSNTCKDTIIHPVWVRSSPTIEFTHDSACDEQVVHFVADPGITHIDSIVSWSWDFGDGSSPVTNPGSATHTYTAPGTFIATLTVTDHHGCINSVSHGVRVNPLPFAEFSWSGPACSGSPVHYTDNSSVPLGYTGFIAKWLWDFGDGTSQLVTLPGSPNVTHTFVGNGMTHTVRLTVWTSDSCSQFIEHGINSIPGPTTDFNTSNIHCTSSPVQFTDASLTNGGGSISQWQWNFNDPLSGINNTSTLQNPTHTYFTSGIYNVRLIVTNLSGCTDTIIKTVDINVAPLADFRADTVCLNSITQFTDLSAPNGGTIIFRTWDFGDGSAISHQQNPTHTYALSGIFNVKLTVVNSNGCSKDTTRAVLVNPLPLASFSYSTPNCLGAVVHYTNLSTTPPGYLGSIVQWVWNFGDGTTTTINAPANPDVSHAFSGTALSHIVRLTVTTSDGCSAYIEHTINSIPSPIADFGFPSANCIAQNVQFSDLTNTNGGGATISWNWNFGDPVSGTNNSSGIQNPSHLFSGSGTYAVSLIVINVDNCTDTVTRPIVISSPPVANFIADTACLQQPTQFSSNSTANAAGIISYLWDFGDGTPSSMLENPSHIYANYGIWTVRLTIINSNGCAHDTTRQILVNPLPVPEFTYPVQSCSGTSIQFTDQSSVISGYPYAIIRWVWDFGDGTPPLTILFPDNPDVAHTFSVAAAAYMVRLTVSASNGCSSFIEHVINVTASPLASFTYPSILCMQQAVQFTDVSQSNGGGVVTQWQWNFGDPVAGTNNTSALQNPVHIFTSAGIYSVTETIYSSSNCSSISVHTLAVNMQPISNFTADTACLGTPTIFTDQSSSSMGVIVQYFWEFGDGTTSTLSSPAHQYPAMGNYQVRLTVTDEYGCRKDTTKTVMIVSAPVVAFSATGPTCLDSLVYFTDNSYAMFGMIHTWEWDFGDGVSTTIVNPASPNTSHLYTNSGNYNVVLSVTTTNGCISTAMNPVFIQPAPIANYVFSSIRCQLSPVQFTDLTLANGGTPVIQWHWNFNDPVSGNSNISTLQNPVHAFSVSGTYTVTLRVTSEAGCLNTISKTVSVNANPLAQFSSDTVCAHSSTQFTDLSIPNASTINSWHWNFGDPASGTANTSSFQNPVHVFSNAGNYLVRLTVINSNSCENETVMVVPVFSTPVAMFQFTSSCMKTPTQFTDLSFSPGGQVSSWFWNFGDGVGTSNVQNPVYTYTTPGTYNVRLRVANLNGCQDSVLIPVVSRPAPIAEYNYNNFFCPNGQVTFHDLSQANGSAIASRLWIFEPGSTSDQHDPVYVFPVSDTNYRVTLIVTNEFGCLDTIIKSVYVKPGYFLTFSQDTVCLHNPTHFHAINIAAGDSLYNLVWNFGDPASGNNNTSSLTDPIHYFTSTGPYNVSLEARNSDNCKDVIYKLVAVNSLPAPAFSSTPHPCEIQTVFKDLTNPGNTQIVKWTWNFGDGSPLITLYSPGSGDTSHAFASAGTYRVILKVTNVKGCADTTSRNLNIPGCISANFDANASTGCTNARISFSDQSLPTNYINRWVWEFGDGSDTVYTNFTGNLHHRYSSAGIYPVILKVSAIVNGNSYLDSTTRLVTINSSPEVIFSTQSACLNQPSLFRDQSDTLGVEITSRKWLFGDPQSGSNNNSILMNPAHIYAATGLYITRLVLINKFGCKDSLIKPVKVHGLPKAAFENSPACSANPVIFLDKSFPADTMSDTWKWNFGDPSSRNDTSSIQDPVYKYKKEGCFRVYLMIQDKNGCKDTADSIITVHPTPVSAFMISDNISGKTGKMHINNKSSGAESYFWDFGNGTTSSDENPWVTYNQDGTYTIMLVSSNQYGCADTTFLNYNVLFKGLYVPNAFAPTTDIQGVNVFKPVGVNLREYNVKVFDSWGHLVWESSDIDGEGRPTGSWNGRKDNGELYQQGTYAWVIRAIFTDGTIWEGSNIGKGDGKTIGTVTLIR